MANAASAIVIECVSPALEGGRHPVKRLVGETLSVTADLFRHGHDLIAAALRWRAPGGEWQRTAMEPLGNDQWRAGFALEQLGVYEYTVEAWTEHFDSWRRDTARKREAGQPIAADLEEGLALACRLLPARERPRQGGAELLLDDEAFAARLRGRPPQREITRAARVWSVLVERPRAAVGAWYEMFPRSQGTDPSRSATFAEAARRLPEIAAMGFDVVYLPPIHPIGHTNRKGRNNSLRAQPGEPGSPYAIGSEAGGHDAIEPSLGTLADFDAFLAAARALKLEIALDFAINCSPDHPYVREHPEWFLHRPDGSIKYAENPPKRYEDIYPLDFDGPHALAIQAEMRRILAFWAERGVRIFRVDNPHTKPMAFWEWLLADLRRDYPDLVFLSEAFTRPRPMKHLAKIGFSQSYTYFTWRNTKAELTEYLSELTGPCREYFRPNFFANTPDILHAFLQTGGRPAFLIRLALAATLAPAYGIYSGFELCENRALPGSEEYQDSEKYQFKVWDWERPGHIKDSVARFNRIRREHPALQRIDTLRWLTARHPDLLLYAKMTPDFRDRLVIAVNLNPFAAADAAIELPANEWGLSEEAGFRVDDLLTGPRGVWRGRHHMLRLEPSQPCAVFQLTAP